MSDSLWEPKTVKFLNLEDGIHHQADAVDFESLKTLMEFYGCWDDAIEQSLRSVHMTTAYEILIDVPTVQHYIKERSNMSNELSLWCISHDPPIESGTVDVLTNIEKFKESIFNKRNTWMAVFSEDIQPWDMSIESGWANALRFFQAHPKCTIELRDEQGVLQDRAPFSKR